MRKRILRQDHLFSVFTLLSLISFAACGPIEVGDDLTFSDAGLASHQNPQNVSDSGTYTSYDAHFSDSGSSYVSNDAGSNSGNNNGAYDSGMSYWNDAGVYDSGCSWDDASSYPSDAPPIKDPNADAGPVADAASEVDAAA